MKTTHTQVLWFPIARAIFGLSHGNLVFSSGEFSQISIHDAPRLFFQVYWSVFHLIHFISLNVSLLATDCIDRKSFCLVPEGWTQTGMDKYKGNIYSTFLTFWSQLFCFCQPMAGIYFWFLENHIDHFVTEKVICYLSDRYKDNCRLNKPIVYIVYIQVYQNSSSSN